MFPVQLIDPRQSEKVKKKMKRQKRSGEYSFLSYLFSRANRRSGAAILFLWNQPSQARSSCDRSAQSCKQIGSFDGDKTET
jgi:hypothetical protein